MIIPWNLRNNVPSSLSPLICDFSLSGSVRPFETTQNVVLSSQSRLVLDVASATVSLQHLTQSSSSYAPHVPTVSVLITSWSQYSLVPIPTVIIDTYIHTYIHTYMNSICKVPCINTAKTRNALKLAAVPQTTVPISAASRSKFTILWGYVEEILLLNNVFLLSICALVVKI